MGPIPNGLAKLRCTHRNRASSQFDDHHGPLVLVQTAEPRYFVVGKMTECKAVASHGPGSERKCLPGVSDVVQAVAVGAVTVLPCLAPRDAGQYKYDRRIAMNHLKI